MTTIICDKPLPDGSQFELTRRRKTMSAKPNSGNTGYEAYKLGREHADSIFRQSGLGTLRKLAWVKPRTDYERGKIGRACEILAKAYEVEAPAEQLQVPKSPTPG